MILCFLGVNITGYRTVLPLDTSQDLTEERGRILHIRFVVGLLKKD